MKYSIVIPTCKSSENFLRPCLESIQSNTDLSNTEIIVVANGCSESIRELATIWHDEPIGFTRAINEGLKASHGEYKILLNDDTVILANTWIPLLEKPFEDPAVGLTGPCKFHWDLGGITREAIGFWCVMFKQSLIDEIGYLDEVYSPGTGEDGDFCIKASLLGYKLISIPNNVSDKFGTGISNTGFPIYHVGNGAFGKMADKNEIIDRNNKILTERFSSRVEKIYDICLNTPGSDIGGLFPTIRKYASRCQHVTEFGVRGVFSTYAFLAARPKRLVSYDIVISSNIWEAADVSKEVGVDFCFKHLDVLKDDIEHTDLLFIDTLHTYTQLSQELRMHSHKARKYIIMHDTNHFGWIDEMGQGSDKHGLQLAIKEFLDENKEWKLIEEIKESNGLTVLERIPKFSIIIPTHNHLDDALRPCLDSIFSFTDLTDKEIIVVPNGCTDGTLDYLSGLRRIVKTINIPEASGYVTPVNVGADASRGEFILLFDNDCMLFAHNKEGWIHLLMDPFLRYPDTGMTGPFVHQYPGLGVAIHSGCALYSRKAWKTVGGFDIIYTYGYLSDTDISLRIAKAGFRVVGVPESKGPRFDSTKGTFKIDFPIYHPSVTTTMNKAANVALMRKNRNMLYERHGPKPKYSVVIPTYNHLDDCLKPCLESLIKHTNLDNMEIIVVANGCKDNTAQYVDSLGHPFKLLWFDEGLGFTKATNEGIKVALGDYIILLNNDVVLLDMAAKNTWIEMLEAPFLTDEKVGITGPLRLFDRYADSDVMIFFCVMIRRDMFDVLGLLDEAFSPGGGEDIDFCVKLLHAGYKQVMVPDENIRKVGTNVGQFPIYHKGEGTFSDTEFPEYGKRIIKDNGMLNMLRYNKHIKLNLGSGGLELPGFLSVDKYDTRASLLIDVEELDKYLPENSVEEMVASHLLEHINPYKSVETLKKWLKILKPGGKLAIEVPNMEELCKDFAAATKQERYGLLNAIYGAVNTRSTDNNLAGEITSPHLWGWYPEMLYDHLVWAGFTNIVFGPELIKHPYKNFRAEASKAV